MILMVSVQNVEEAREALEAAAEELDRDDTGASREPAREALEALEVPGDFVHLVMVNNKIEPDRERVLADDDEMMVMPPVGAG